MQSNEFFLIGVALVFLGVLALLYSVAGQNTKIKTGGVLLIGPIPIIFGNDKNMVVLAVVGAVVLMLATFFLFYYKR